MYTYISFLISLPPIHSHHTPLVSHIAHAELLVLYSSFPLIICFTYVSTFMSVLVGRNRETDVEYGLVDTAGEGEGRIFFFNENFQRSFKDKSFVSLSWYLSWYRRDFSQYILASLLTLQHLHLQYLFLVTSIPKMKLCICFWKNYYECSFFTYYLQILGSL